MIYGLTAIYMFLSMAAIILVDGRNSVLRDDLAASQSEYALCSQSLAETRSRLAVCEARPSESTVEASR